MNIKYKINEEISAQQFIDVLERSSLVERRPIEDLEIIDGMLRHGNLCVTAWDQEKLVGISRSVTDFVYACYLSELAVDESYQRLGIGKELVLKTRKQLGHRCKIRLISAPDADNYYPKIGFIKNERCWELK